MRRLAPERQVGAVDHAASAQSACDAAHAGNAGSAGCAETPRSAQVGGDDAQQVVAAARHHVALHHLRQSATACSKSAMWSSVWPVSSDRDEDVDRQAHPVLVEQGDVAADDPRLLQQLLPAVAGRGDRPAASDSSALVARPSRCRWSRMARSIRSSSHSGNPCRCCGASLAILPKSPSATPNFGKNRHALRAYIWDRKLPQSA